MKSTCRSCWPGIEGSGGVERVRDERAAAEHRPVVVARMDSEVLRDVEHGERMRDGRGEEPVHVGLQKPRVIEGSSSRLGDEVQLVDAGADHTEL